MKIAFVSGKFNILHPGHLRLFRAAKKIADKLVVGVLNDKKVGSSTIVDQYLRLESVKSISLVDEAFIIENSLKEDLLRIKPNYVLKGKEHEKKINEEIHIINEWDGKLIFNSGEMFFSSSDLIKHEIDEVRSQKPYDFINRHELNNNNLKKIIENYSNLSICVIGDLILDQYINCDPLGMSQEDPAIVVTPTDDKLFIGGAGIVSAHASNLGANVDFYSVTGTDNDSVISTNILKENNVNFINFPDEGRPTTKKIRYKAKNQTLLKVSYLRQHQIDASIEDGLIKNVLKNIDKYNLIVFSDFNYGLITKNIIEKISSVAQSKRIIVVADCQSSSQIGDILKYKNINLITPTEHEARISLKNKDDGIVVLSEKLRKLSGVENILLKLGVDGILIHAGDNKNFETDQIPALNTNAIDTAGAGDSFLIVSSLSLACSANIWEASLLGSYAASIQVSRIGNIPISKQELLSIL